jgi:hypothetical protein
MEPGPAVLGAVRSEHDRFPAEMSCSDASWSREPIMKVQDVKVYSLAHIGDLLFYEVVEQENPGEEVGVAHLAFATIYLESSGLFVVRRARKIQGENMHFVSLID